MYFEYRGKKSSDFCLKIKEINNYSSPSRALETHVVPGRHGELVIDNGHYNNFRLQITCFLDGRPERNGKKLSLAELATELKAWLQEGDYGYSPIKLENEEYYYEGYLENYLDIKELFTNFAEVLLTFNCKPFRKKDSDDVIVITEKNTVITNNGIDSEPYIKVFGSGDITLSIGEQLIKFVNVEQYIEIDSELMNCYKNGVNQNNRMFGDFPVLKRGDNSVSFTGNVTKIEIRPRWVRL